MMYMLVIPDKHLFRTTITELTKDAYVVPIDTPQANDAMANVDAEFFVNAPDNEFCTVIPVIESVEHNEQPVIELTRDLVETFLERFAQMEDPDDSLMETEFLINGVKVKLVD